MSEHRKVKIEKLFKKPVLTKYGERTGLNFISANNFYSTFEGDWNKSWKVGDIVEIDVEAREYTKDGQIKIAYNIIAPKKSAGVDEELKSKINEMYTMLVDIKGLLQRGSQSVIDNEIMPIDDSDLPF